MALVGGRFLAHHRVMRLLLPLLLFLAAPAALATVVPTPPEPEPMSRASLFLSPMGEPFPSPQPLADNVGTWFAAADLDGNGALTLAEMNDDAARFFALLDIDRDGEIEMAEIARYENEIAPEVQVGQQMRSTGVGDWHGGRRKRVWVFERGIDGAGRYSFLNIPHPVMAADYDLNRGVSRAEFAQAAAERFGQLDKDRDGRLARAELPPLPQPRLRRPKSDGNPSRRPIGTSTQ